MFNPNEDLFCMLSAITDVQRQAYQSAEEFAAHRYREQIQKLTEENERLRERVADLEQQASDEAFESDRLFE